MFRWCCRVLGGGCRGWPALLLALWAGAGAAAEFLVEGSAIRISGRIERGDLARFQAVLATPQGRQVFESHGTFLLDSPGGRVREAYRIARIIELGVSTTVVPAGARCLSACFLLYAAGSYRSMGERAALGVHRASSSTADAAAHARMDAALGAYLRRRGVPEAILERMNGTEPADMFLFGNRWLVDQGLDQQMAGHPGFMEQVGQRCGADPLLVPEAAAPAVSAHARWLDCLATVRQAQRPATAPELLSLLAR